MKKAKYYITTIITILSFNSYCSTSHTETKEIAPQTTQEAVKEQIAEHFPEDEHECKNLYNNIFSRSKCNKMKCTNFGSEKVTFKILKSNNSGAIENIICTLNSGESQELESPDPYLFTGLKKLQPHTYWNWKFSKNKVVLSVTTGSPIIENVKNSFELKRKYYPNLDNPTTFNEKITWIMLNYQPYMSLFTDKLLVRQYVQEKGYPHTLIPLLDHSDQFENINWERLPEKFVIKTNHDSGGVWVVNRKIDVNYDYMKFLVNNQLLQTYGITSNEPHYQTIEARVIVETLLESEKPLVDYKIFCFNGKSKYIHCITSLLSNPKDNFFDTKWNSLGKVTTRELGVEAFNKPKKLEEMITMAEVLCKGFDFARCDLYFVNDTIYFGELTFTPHAGCFFFSDFKWDKSFGEELILSNLVTKN